MTGTLREDRCTPLRMRKFSDKIIREYQTRILCSETCFLLYDNVEKKHGTAVQVTDDTMGHVVSMLNN
jgi:hypothetical protein